ncbi:MAG: hypothetical protein QOJ38_1781 [Solirubrobacterales bacterium]|jgi:uncharacterized protein YwgA|nr:hypothetical protein [Solirubrobacterales bacterium]
MTPADWLLLLIALPPAEPGLDPVRLQKGAFLLAHEAGLVAAERYSFAPYNYGPMSRDVYGDADRLVAAGLVEKLPVSGYSWSRFRATARGARRAEVLLKGGGAAASAVVDLRRIKHEIATASFASLLADVYERYPSYAVRSVFRGP